MELASSLPSTMLIPLTQVAVFGIGTTKSAFPALKDGSSILTKFVLLFLTNAPVTITTVLASPASKDTT